MLGRSTREEEPWKAPSESGAEGEEKAGYQGNDTPTCKSERISVMLEQAD
jgi:hypothetical protein